MPSSEAAFLEAITEVYEQDADTARIAPPARPALEAVPTAIHRGLGQRLIAGEIVPAGSRNARPRETSSAAPDVDARGTGLFDSFAETRYHRPSSALWDAAVLDWFHEGDHPPEPETELFADAPTPAARWRWALGLGIGALASAALVLLLLA